MKTPKLLRRRTAVVALFLLVAVPLAFGQSLGEVAKKERERRKKNKDEGREVLVIAENEIWPEEETGDDEGEDVDVDEEGPSRPGATSSRAGVGATPTSVRSEEETLDEYDLEMEGDVPDFIPPDLPLDQKLQMFERMKRHYRSQVREIDESIAENEARLRELEQEIAETSAMGGAGLPVAPRAGTGSTQPLTGQESVTLVAEQQRLERLTENLRERKEQLRLSLQEKGRVAGIPRGYLRF